VESYLSYQGSKFVQRLDASSYLYITRMLDMYDLEEEFGSLEDAFRHTKGRFLIVSISSDWLFPPFQSRQIVEALLAEDRPVSYCNIQSRCGHDGFLLEDDLDRYGGMIRAFLDDLAAEIAPRPAPAPVEPEPPREDPAHADPVNIFHARRLDYGLIAERIEPGTSVLDLGCGEGGLLSELRSRGHDRIMGVEIDEKQILACIEAGHHVVQADLNQPLSIFGDQQFDYVVLSQTLQALLKVDVMIEEFLRIGRRVVVSYPNFAYHRLVTMLTDEGRSPLTRSGKGLLRYNWYNSPNIRFFSIRDFQEFCADRGIRIHEQIFLDTEAQAEIVDAPNRDADLCISVISR